MNELYQLLADALVDLGLTEEDDEPLAQMSECLVDLGLDEVGAAGAAGDGVNGGPAGWAAGR